MKKIYTSALAVALVSGSAFAQQLPNADFEGGWVDCIPWNTANTNKVQGTTPNGWCVSNVVTPGMSLGNATVADKVEGNDSESAVRVYNKSTFGQVIPGYFTLGTTWATAYIDNFVPTEADGGVWGGIEFTARPDAIMFDYKHTQGKDSEECATFVAYAWKGQTSQVDVPGANGFSVKPETCTMVNRDRNILGMETSQGGVVTKSDDFAKIASKIEHITDVNTEWNTLTVPLEYFSADIPEKFNVIFAAGDYFEDRSNLKGDDRLVVDNVKLLYYSRLSEIQINDTDIAGFEPDKYNYTVDALLPEASAISYTALGASGSARVNVQLDAAKAQAIITVTNTNEGGLDVDGEAQHVYTLQFNAQPAEVVETVIYKGLLSVDLMGEVSEIPDQPISMFTMSDGTYTMLLENFGSTDEDPEGIGTIRVEGITNDDDGLHGYAPEILLMGGGIKASATVTGTMNGNDISLVIACLWDASEMGMGEVPINVTFEGSREEQKASYTYRRKYTDTSKRYYNRIAATVNETETVLHETADATQEDYYVAPVNGSWQEEGAYIDFTNKAIEVPEGTESFTVNLRSDASGTTSTKWSQNCLYVDWNNNGEFTDEGETKGVMDLGSKPNAGTGNVTVSPMGKNETVVVPATAKAGDTYTMLICLMEPKDIATAADRWGDNWDWSKDIFADGVCSLINGQAYAFTVKMTTPSAINNVAVDENAPVEYFNLQGVRVAADNLTPGIYVRRQGGKTVKVLVK